VTVPIAAQLANQQRSSWVKLFAISKQFYDEPTYFGLIAAAPVNPLAFVRWIQGFYSGDIQNPIDQRWFGFHSPTRLYVAGPIEKLTFKCRIAGLDPDGSGFADVYICVNRHLEADPT
jgi:hypothetical protein